MWWRNVFLALIGISAGMVVAGGVFSFIDELGVISDFADRTHTAKHILFMKIGFCWCCTGKFVSDF